MNREESTFRPAMLKAGLGLMPGLVLAAVVAGGSIPIAAMLSCAMPIPAMVIALLLGMLLFPLGRLALFQPGIKLCASLLLRAAVALLGLRIAIGDILSLGTGTALVIVAAMTLTMVSGFALARLLGQSAYYGALAAAASAVCGASATLATSTVLPSYPRKDADVAFVVIGVNVLATLAMLLYPFLCGALGFDHQRSGALFGGAIHDMAQVVGAGYATSETSGNVAVIVKLFRISLLLPVVVLVGWRFRQTQALAVRARVPVPAFIIVFLGLCVINSVIPLYPSLVPLYMPVKEALVGLSGIGLLLAIAALGLNTSLAALAAMGWRQGAILVGTTLVILSAVATGLMMLPLR
jgi:uncharacterized integral membrane protein (TIGR00698 family)